MAVTVLGTAAPAVAQSIDGGTCSLLTKNDLSKALGGRRWSIAEGEDQPLNCYYINNMMDRKSKALNLKYTLATEDAVQDFQEMIRDGYSDEKEIDVGGFPALQIDSTIHVFTDPAAWLSLDLISDRNADDRKVPQLAAQAVARLTDALVTDAAATEACAIVTAQEASTALGEVVTAAQGSPTACQYVGDVAAGSTTSLSVEVSPLDAFVAPIMQDEMLGGLPGASAVEIAGVPAVQAGVDVTESGASSSQLAIFAADQEALLLLSAAVPAGVDVTAALASLGALAVPRLGG